MEWENRNILLKWHDSLFVQKEPSPVWGGFLWKKKLIVTQRVEVKNLWNLNIHCLYFKILFLDLVPTQLNPVQLHMTSLWCILMLSHLCVHFRRELFHHALRAKYYKRISPCMWPYLSRLSGERTSVTMHDTFSVTLTVLPIRTSGGSLLVSWPRPAYLLYLTVFYLRK
jgi:hypothetical protein